MNFEGACKIRVECLPASAQRDEELSRLKEWIRDEQSIYKPIYRSIGSVGSAKHTFIQCAKFPQVIYIKQSFSTSSCLYGNRTKQFSGFDKPAWVALKPENYNFWEERRKVAPNGGPAWITRLLLLYNWNREKRGAWIFIETERKSWCCRLPTPRDLLRKIKKYFSNATFFLDLGHQIPRKRFASMINGPERRISARSNHERAKKRKKTLEISWQKSSCHVGILVYKLMITNFPHWSFLLHTMPNLEEARSLSFKCYMRLSRILFTAISVDDVRDLTASNNGH